MTLALVIAAAVLVITVRGIWKTGQARIAAHGIHALLWRWFTGAAWHGDPVTDAGWARPGRRALTRTGHASRFHHRPRWQRALIRTGWTGGVLLTLYGMAENAAVTLRFMLAALVLGVLGGCWVGWLAIRQRKHRRSWVEPLHVVCAPLAGIPVANPPKSWLAIEPDRSKAVLALPPGHDFSDPKKQEVLARAASATLGLENPDVRWRLGGPERTLTILRSQPPPEKVVLDGIRQAIDDAGADVLVIGLGRDGKPVTISLHGDSPHVGLSMGSGAGKSVTARFLAAQMAFKGALLLVLDPKEISQMWASGLPNVAYARSAEELHNALLWLQGEVMRRNGVARVSADVEGNVNANVGPRIFVVAEELNAMMKRLRRYWTRERESGDPIRSPALDALDEVMFTGRQVRVNVLMIGQRLSAEATGGGDARENLAALIFARYRPATWKMLVPDMPMPPATRHPGRVEVVTTGVRQAQVALLSGAEARSLALAGRVALPRADMPYCGPPLTADTVTQEVALRDPDLGNATVSNGQNGQPPQMPAIEPVTLKTAVEAGLFGSLSLAGVRTARARKDDFPEPVGRDGLAHLFDPLELEAWCLSQKK